MSNHISANNSFLQSQNSPSQNSELKHLLTINLNSSISFPRDSLPVVPAFEQNVCGSLDQKAVRFYWEYLKQFQKNKRLNHQLTEVIQDRNLLADKYNSIKTIKTLEDSVHRKRRYAKDIERLFYCPIEKCKKGYGSEGSLSHHVRLKHLQFHQSGMYEIFIQKYLDDMKESKKKPDEKITPNSRMTRQMHFYLQNGEQRCRRMSLRQNKKSNEDQK